VKPQAKRNITLSLPVDLIQQLKILAAQRNTSISGLITEQAQQIVPPVDDSTSLLRELIESAPNSGFGEKIPWTRDEIYDRHER